MESGTHDDRYQNIRYTNQIFQNITYSIVIKSHTMSGRHHKTYLHIVTVNCLIVKTDCTNQMLKFNKKFSNSETQRSKM